MIIVSDNVATEVLVEALGGPDVINKTAHRLGSPTTRWLGSARMDHVAAGHLVSESSPRHLAERSGPGRVAHQSPYSAGMADARRRYSDDVPPEIEARARELCLRLPEAYEEQAWLGTRWMVRKRTFAHVLGVDDGAGPYVVVAFRAAGEELEVLRHTGRPFVVLGWGRDAMGLVLDSGTDWDDVRELVTESYCVMAPQKLIALLDRPD